MFVGNLGALVQTNVKRLLAYSSIAHAGYILVAFAAVTSLAQEDIKNAVPAFAAILFYLLSYALVKIGAFSIVSQLGGEGEKHVSLDDFAGLAQRQPVAQRRWRYIFCRCWGCRLLQDSSEILYFQSGGGFASDLAGGHHGDQQRDWRLLLFAADRGDVHAGFEFRNGQCGPGAIPDDSGICAFVYGGRHSLLWVVSE